MGRPFECCALALLCAGFMSCSVKELRTECPCIVALDLSDCQRYQGTVHLGAWTAQRNVLQTDVDRDSCTSLFEMSVPRGMLLYSVTVGEDGSATKGQELRVPPGGQCPRLFACAAAISADGESVTDTVTLHKQFSRVTARLAGRPAPDDSGISISVSSGWNGLSLETLSPLAGELHFCPERGTDGSWSFDLLRQGDNSVSIGIWIDGKLEDSFPLGRALADTGFDWTSEDLDDIRLGIDCARAEIAVEIDDWIPGGVYDVKQ